MNLTPAIVPIRHCHEKSFCAYRNLMKKRPTTFVRELHGSNLSEIEVMARVNDALAEASHILHAAWPAVMAIAAALVRAVSECGLDGNEIVSLIDEALREPR